MKYIEVDEELYRYIASKTEQIGESASSILRRLLGFSVDSNDTLPPKVISHPGNDSSSMAKMVVHKNNQFVSSIIMPEKAIGPATTDPFSFADLISEKSLSQKQKAVERFIFILECLYTQFPNTFSNVLNIKGRDRIYFAKSKKALTEVRDTTNPKEIGNSGYWVTTNNNTAKKRNIVLEALELFGCDHEQAQELANRI